MAELLREIETGMEDRETNVIAGVLGMEEEKPVVDLGAFEGRVVMLLARREERTTDE